MSESSSPKLASSTKAALTRAGRRAGIHLVQALIEALRAVEAVIDEIAGIVDADHDEEAKVVRQKIDVQ